MFSTSSRIATRLLFLFVLISVGSFFESTAQAQTVLTNDSVMKLVMAGLGEDVILSMVNTQAGKYSLGTDDLIALKKASVSDKIIAAMVSKGQGGAPAKAVESATAPSVDSTATMDVGVYFKKKDEWVEVLPEVINWKTGGVFKNLATGGLVKGDVNGNIKGAHSKNSILTPLEFLVKTQEGIAITEYQLLRLHENKDEREFRTVTGGVLHTSGGATRDLLPFEGKKVTNRTYSVLLPSLGAGEYGFLPPGAVTSSSAASVGKMYTFRIVE